MVSNNLTAAMLAATALFLPMPLEARPAGEACVPPQMEGQSLEDWAAAGFPTDQGGMVARQLAGCADETDPFLRDAIGFTGLSAILRRGDVDPATARVLIADLTAKLDAPDPEGVSRSFAILMLSELTRMDRVSRFLEDGEFDDLVGTAAGAMRETDDYRGYDEVVGWRHRVAHSADFALQLVLNDRTSAAQLASLRSAIATQVAPSVPYTAGEPRRLARPLLYLALRGEPKFQDWEAFLESIVTATKAENQATDQMSLRLARDHNLRSFLLELYGSASISGEEALAGLAAGAATGLAKMVQ